MQYFASIVIALAGACGSSAPKQKQPPPADLPVSLETARATALAQVQGQWTIEEEDLDDKKGRWVYEFDLRPTTVGMAKKEIEVDATTGAVVKVEDDD
jgi:uncharacterized membrane protein YkoI